MRTLNTMVKHLNLILKSQRFMSTKTSEGGGGNPEGGLGRRNQRWAGRTKFRDARSLKQHSGVAKRQVTLERSWQDFDPWGKEGAVRVTSQQAASLAHHAQG